MKTKTDYFILIPPSESKKSQGKEKEKTSFQELETKREILKNKLIEYCEKAKFEDLHKSFKISKNREDYLREVNSELHNAKALLAIERFTGTMYRALDYKALPIKCKANFDNKILIVDGLYGLIKPKDQIQNYKLMMGTKLNKQSTADYWKATITSKLNNLEKNALIIDLLPQSHRKAIDYSKLKKYICINFYEMKNNSPKNSGHNSKKLKAALIHSLIGEEKISKNKLIQFEHPQGHKYSKILSSEKEIIYLKD